MRKEAEMKMADLLPLKICPFTVTILRQGKWTCPNLKIKESITKIGEVPEYLG